MGRGPLWWTLLKLKSPFAGMRVGAVHDLEAVGDARAIAQLATALRDTTPRVREAATQALGRAGGAQAMEVLIAALADHDSNVREGATQALGAIDPSWAKSEAARKAVPMLSAALADSGGTLARAIRVEARQEARTRWWRDGAPSASFVREVRGHYVSRRRAAAARLLGRIGDARAIAPLVAALADPTPEVRQDAARALGQIGDTRAVEPLAAALRDDYGASEAAGEALVQIGGARALRSLASALGDDSESVRWLACRMLSRIADARVVEPLVSALADPNDRIREAAAGALDSLGWQPVDDAQRALRAVALAKFEEAAALGSAAVGPLAFALRDRSFHLRTGAARALGQIGDLQAVEQLTSTLGGHDWGVRRAACQALGQLGDVKAVEQFLRVALGDRDWNLCRAACEALGRLGDARAVPTLAAALSAADRGLRADITRALEMIDPHWNTAAATEATIFALIEALQDQQPDVQGAAAEALGQIGDPRAVAPLNRAIQASTSFPVHLAYYRGLQRIPGGELVPLSHQVLVESFATRIRFLYARTRTVVDSEYWNAFGASGYAGEWIVTASHEEPDPDIGGIRELIALLPDELRERVRALSGEVAPFFS
jgi:HEAT repeat protein